MSDLSSNPQRKIFACPACQGKLAVPVELLGRKFKCRHCGKGVQTPLPTAGPGNDAPQGIQPLSSRDASPPLPPVLPSPSGPIVSQVPAPQVAAPQVAAPQVAVPQVAVPQLAVPHATEHIVTAEIVESAPASPPIDVGPPKVSINTGAPRRSTSRVSSSRRKKSSNGGVWGVLGSLGGVLLILAVVGVRFGIRQYAEMQYEQECDSARIEAYQHYADIATPDVVKAMVDDFHEECVAEATHGIRTPRFAKDEYFVAMDQLFRQAIEFQRDQLQDMLDGMRH